MGRQSHPEYIGKPPEAVRAFQAQRTTARRRGIPFLFTFTEWWEWWQTDNRWANRGMGRDKFVMARKGDQGPYSPENVYCATHRQNFYDVSPDVRRQAARHGWSAHPDRRSHLADRERHPACRPIRTPDGRFPSAALAAEHYGFTRQNAARLAREGKNGWKWDDRKYPDPGSLR